MEGPAPLRCTREKMLGGRGMHAGPAEVGLTGVECDAGERASTRSVETAAACFVGTTVPATTVLRRKEVERVGMEAGGGPSVAAEDTLSWWSSSRDLTLTAANDMVCSAKVHIHVGGKNCQAGYKQFHSLTSSYMYMYMHIHCIGLVPVIGEP